MSPYRLFLFIIGIDRIADSIGILEFLDLMKKLPISAVSSDNSSQQANFATGADCCFVCFEQFCPLEGFIINYFIEEVHTQCCRTRGTFLFFKIKIIIFN